MKNPRIGERVRAYTGFSSVVGQIICVEGNIVKIGKTGDFDCYDRRQCVRLVKKKRREYWIVAPVDKAWTVYGSRYDADECTGEGVNIIHVREVKK
jgi:hypothetical protein